MQLRKNTIEKHCRKIYYKENVDGKVENKSRWKNAKYCKHVENVGMYEKNIRNDHSKKMKGSLYSLFKEKVSTKM